jgi:hypothetical protein
LRETSFRAISRLQMTSLDFPPALLVTNRVRSSHDSLMTEWHLSPFGQAVTSPPGSPK